MTAREMIDSLSGTLLRDERILSVPEKELLANLLQRTRTQSSAPENAVAEAIARNVGELIAERALGVLGASMTQQLLDQQLTWSSKPSNGSLPVVHAGSPPTNPPPPVPAVLRVRPGRVHRQSASGHRPLTLQFHRAVLLGRRAPARPRSASGHHPPTLQFHRAVLLGRRASARPRSHFQPRPRNPQRPQWRFSRPLITFRPNA